MANKEQVAGIKTGLEAQRGKIKSDRVIPIGDLVGGQTGDFLVANETQVECAASLVPGLRMSLSG